MKRDFFLAVEWVSSPKPRRCRLIRSVKTTDGSTLYEVDLSPPMPENIAGTVADVSRAFLGICAADVTLKDIGKKVVMVDIFHIPLLPPGNVRPEQTVRVGMGSLHSSMEKANEVSAVD